MIGKIVTGKSFGGAVRYLLGKEPGKAYILTSDGVELTSRQALIGSFEFQRRARPDVERVVGHISLSFHPDDDPRMSNRLMLDLAREYMQRMEITGTQYLVVRHTDTKHPHLHILYNRVRYDMTLVPDRNERLRNMRICKELKQVYGLTFSHGKEQVATERLHGPEQLRHRIYNHLRELLSDCTSWTALAEELIKRQVATTFVYRGGDPTKEIQGVTFTLEGHTFKASQVDRKFSYGRLSQRIEQNRLRLAMVERVRNYADEQRPQVSAILQSGCDATLRRMNRHYDTTQYRAVAEAVRKAFPGAALTTDMMVGFAGETEVDHQESLQFAREIGFAKIHAFAYSQRPGTRAAAMPDQVSPADKKRRCAELIAVAAELRKTALTAMLGQTQLVLFESRGQQGCTGYTPNYTPVTVCDPAAHPGDIRPVLLTAIAPDADGCEGILTD